MKWLLGLSAALVTAFYACLRQKIQLHEELKQAVKREKEHEEMDSVFSAVERMPVDELRRRLRTGHKK